MSEATLSKIRLRIQRSTPDSTPLYWALADNVAYIVQPPAAAPPGTKKLYNTNTAAGSVNQKENMLSSGKAMSPAPIMSGIRKLPNPPTKNGVTTKKIMIVACIVNSEL